MRCSGPESLAILKTIFRATSTSFSAFFPRYLHHGIIQDADGAALDEGLVVFFPGPHSFTGEDVAELHCHGGCSLLRGVVEAILQTGLARPAQAGEFSRRAFLHGKLDLAQAEAVAEAIAAPTTMAASLAQGRLSGALSLQVNALQDSLEALRRDCVLAVDFPEDEVECLPPEALQCTVGEALRTIEGLVSLHRRTRLHREGAMVVLAGRVNAGKSSLLNALLGRQRAIVSNTPGTTRDYMEESLLLGGMGIRVVDTAGLRGADGGSHICIDGVEAQGIARSHELMEAADLVVLVVDVREAEHGLACGPEAALLQQWADKTLIVMNKIDILQSEPPAFPNSLAISAATGEGLDALTAALRERLSHQVAELPPGALVPNLRQTQCLEAAGQSLSQLLQDHAIGLPPDLLAQHLDGACRLLEELTGAITSDAILDQIFSSFCIGK